MRKDSNQPHGQCRTMMVLRITNGGEIRNAARFGSCYETRRVRETGLFLCEWEHAACFGFSFPRSSKGARSMLPSCPSSVALDQRPSTWPPVSKKCKE